ncbi:MAG: hypothetical protein J2P53_13755 [Bradyrhizobiaceae bacterium]|nr:hypothetical protein [Bradyrhizobiaceae bacterium]
MTITIDMPGTFRLGAVFSTSVKAFGRHALVFIIVSAIAHIPGYLWSSSVVDDYAWALPSPWADWLIPVTGLISVLIAYGAMIYAVLQDLAGRPVAITKAITIVTRRLLLLMGALVPIMALIGLARPVFPESRTEAAVIGFAVASFALTAISWLVMMMYFAAAPVCVAEQVGIGAALSRGRFLTKGYRWRIFVTILLVGTLEFAIMMIGSAVAFSLALIRHWEVHHVTITVIGVILPVLGAYNAALAAVFYDRLRSAKDGVHLAKVFD